MKLINSIPFNLELPDPRGFSRYFRTYMATERIRAIPTYYDLRLEGNKLIEGKQIPITSPLARVLRDIYDEELTKEISNFKSDFEVKNELLKLRKRFVLINCEDN